MGKWDDELLNLSIDEHGIAAWTSLRDPTFLHLGVIQQRVSPNPDPVSAVDASCRFEVRATGHWDF